MRAKFKRTCEGIDGDLPGRGPTSDFREPKLHGRLPTHEGHSAVNEQPSRLRRLVVRSSPRRARS
ncbi:protein of unknown function (plasmid) [Paraburkholderia dioscoreae]|uniref:Uncharacterized protein n=1 Tax=Paraburkholderia dioscoreae TaxID=2604047 RepID=A0A5Q4ZH08_9BURK|nr:protein of unknown function [Paraburkholderia dioscoreae]